MASDDVRNKVRPNYPFSAIVGNDNVKKAITCSLASPDITSMLICGPKGTGKSVMANSISSIAGTRKIVTLPLNATEDQIFGGMDMERTMKDGKKALSDSILLRSDNNILLVENINLLPEYLLYQIMNAAGTRYNTVEREGISETHNCELLLVATMDPDEGGLSEHLLDRFDVCVFTSNIDDETLREEIIKRRLAYETDPKKFIDSYAEEEEEVSANINKARSKARFTRVPAGYCGAISEVCNELNVAGHRGDISVMNAACAIAALDDREMTNLDDLKNAAAICLEHRRNDRDDDQQQQEPPEPPEENDDQENEDQEDDKENDERDQEENPDNDQQPPPPLPQQDEDLKEEVFSIGDTFRVIDYMPNAEKIQDTGKSGRHSQSKSNDKAGRCVGYRIPKGKISDIALCASIRASAPYQILRDHKDMAIVLEADDLREKVREKKQGNCVLFLVDGSGSIGAQKRMVAVKGAILSMLKDAYQKRDEIGMAVFRIDKAEEILPLTKSTLKAYKVLAEIPTGGRTPLIHGLLKGYEILKDRITKNSSPVMVILSDGRCNAPYTAGMRPIDEMLSTARSLSESNIRFIVIDTEIGTLKFGLALELCRALNGTYLCLEDLNAEFIESSVRLVMREV
ncbi:MAG: VWA domain-containing protein [Candidatus Methanoplasma sp.]|jgi:magnesium chelatase subunit D|nr:VWA domain-containing protein [Candidatus Methanoplasma sp.]